MLPVGKNLEWILGYKTFVRLYKNSKGYNALKGRKACHFWAIYWQKWIDACELVKAGNSSCSAASHRNCLPLYMPLFIKCTPPVLAVYLSWSFYLLSACFSAPPPPQHPPVGSWGKIKSNWKKKHMHREGWDQSLNAILKCYKVFTTLFWFV